MHSSPPLVPLAASLPADDAPAGSLPPPGATPSEPGPGGGDQGSLGSGFGHESPYEPAPLPLTKPPAPPRPSYAFLAAMALLNLVADLGTKAWAERTLQTPSLIPTPKPLLKGALGFGFMLARNKGGAWGLLHSYDEKIRKPFFVTVSVLAIVFIVSLYRKLHPSQVALRWGLPLVLGGALGNLVDRIRYGHVIDFIDVSITTQGAQHHWPTFNVADISICVGVALMAVDMLGGRRHGLLTSHPAPPSPAPVTEPAPLPAGAAEPPTEGPH